MNVVCVLKSGGVYDAEYVYRLREGVEAHLDGIEWHCLSDVPEVATIPLKHGWSGWWSKLELFRPKLFTEPTLYLDLDTVVTGDLYEIAGAVEGFTMLTDFTRPREVASGVMGWSGDWSHLYTTFAENPRKWMNFYQRRGDGLFIADHLPTIPARWDHLVPGQIVSYKQHCRTYGVPADARLVCFHGNPRPRDVDWDPHG